MTTRQFLQTASDARNGVRELLQTIFAAELLAPSRSLWVVSPWLRDVPILDNTANGFVSLGSRFPASQIRLSLVLAELALRGTQLILATRHEPGNRQVLDALNNLLVPNNSIIFHERGDLHAKGIVGDSFALLGSMNLTFNGLERLTEMIVFETTRARVEEIRIAFRNEYGGTV